MTSIHRANSTDRTRRLLAGKWVRFSGKVDDYEGKGEIYLENPLPFASMLLIRLHFGEGWHEQLSALRRCSRIMIRDQIAAIEGSSIALNGCELL
jgi:hypothetical protein